MMMKFRTMIENVEKQSGPIMVNEGKGAISSFW